MMKDYQNRVIEEKRDLDSKLERLNKFMLGEEFKTLPDAEISDLTGQRGAMQEYSDILASRISRF